MICLIKTQRLHIRIEEVEDAERIFSYLFDFDENKYKGWFPESMNGQATHCSFSRSEKYSITPINQAIGI